MRFLLVALAAASLLAGHPGAQASLDHRLFVQQAVVRAIDAWQRCRVSGGRGHAGRAATRALPHLPPRSPRRRLRPGSRSTTGTSCTPGPTREWRCGPLCGGWARARSCRHSRAAHHRAARRPAQEYERRFLVWLDNLKFVLDYNARHTSHWVRRRRLRPGCRPASCVFACCCWHDPRHS